MQLVVPHIVAPSGLSCGVPCIYMSITHPPHTPLASYYNQGCRRDIRSADITDALRAAARITGDELGIRPEDISASYLRAGGAMALLCAQVDSDLIKLLGHWQSDTMMRYLHVQGRPVMRNFAARMLHRGNYDLVHNTHTQNQKAPPNAFHTNTPAPILHHHSRRAPPLNTILQQHKPSTSPILLRPRRLAPPTWTHPFTTFPTIIYH
jgi:hypothetical protein